MNRTRLAAVAMAVAGLTGGTAAATSPTTFTDRRTPPTPDTSHDQPADTVSDAADSGATIDPHAALAARYEDMTALLSDTYSQQLDAMGAINLPALPELNLTDIDAGGFDAVPLGADVVAQSAQISALVTQSGARWADTLVAQQAARFGQLDAPVMPELDMEALGAIVAAAGDRLAMDDPAAFTALINGDTTSTQQAWHDAAKAAGSDLGANSDQLANGDPCLAAMATAAATGDVADALSVGETCRTDSAVACAMSGSYFHNRLVGGVTDAAQLLPPGDVANLPSWQQRFLTTPSASSTPLSSQLADASGCATDSTVEKAADVVVPNVWKALADSPAHTPTTSDLGAFSRFGD